jgi:hypothetical protein
MISIILAFHDGNKDQAERFLRHFKIPPPKGCRFFLETQVRNQNPELLPAGWEWMTDFLDVKTKWSDGEPNADGANSMWQQAAREACRLKIGPWLWLEPDCAFLNPEAHSILSEEYYRAGKSYMGGFAPSKTVRMSGVAVYAQDTSRNCPKAMMTRELAFDVAGDQEFKKLGVHFTDLIADQFRCPPFTDQSDFNARVPREAVLHHGDKSGSIYPFIGGTSYEPQPEVIHMGDPVVFQRVPDRPDQITDMLNQKANDTPVVLTVVQHLDCIMELVGDSKPKRAMLYGELQKRGIECGRKPKKPALRKETAKAH